MATRTETIIDAGHGDQCVVMRGVGWKGYASVLRVRGERSVPRIVYLDGDLYLMSPAFRHELLRNRLGHFVVEVVVGLDINCTPAGQTTFRRRKKDGGVEGDETFYLTNEPRIRGKTELRLRDDPPPDLAIEAVNSHAADAAVEVWRRFKVPEVWVCDDEALRILTLRPDGRYEQAEASLAFPFLTTAEIFEWVTRPTNDRPETDWLKALRRWVAGPLAERARAARADTTPKEDTARPKDFPGPG